MIKLSVAEESIICLPAYQAQRKGLLEMELTRDNGIQTRNMYYREEINSLCLH